MDKVLTMKSNKNEINEAMRQAQANLDIEGIKVSVESDALIRRVLRGEISQADFLNAAIEIAKRG